jgi:hypothetical protein
MINFNTLPQTLTAAIGSVLISTMFIVASVGPVRAAPTIQSSAQAQA